MVHPLRLLPETAFVAGLTALAWVGSGYVGASPLALSVVILIGAFYVAGGAELRRFRGATTGLAAALADLHETPARLDAWLERVPAVLRPAVRLRVVGERGSLPGPAMAPYLAGLLVLLGMLGTFIGMVVTLRGTGKALDGAPDLATIRASLSAPVQGLGLAFGTSIAGVAASAMLGLAAALCRRERLVVVATLDAQIATRLRVFGAAHRRDEWWKLQQDQAHALPELVERVAAMTSALEQRNEALNTRLLTAQDEFHARAAAAYAGLAASVDRTLKETFAASAQTAGAALHSAVESAMAGIARESHALHQSIEQGVEHRLVTVSQGFAADAAAVAEHWQRALSAHQLAGQVQATALGATLDRFSQVFDDRSRALVERLTHDTQQALVAGSATFHEHTAALVQQVAQHQALARAETQRALLAAHEAQLRSTMDEVGRLMQSAEAAPLAAAEVIADMRQQLATGLARDNAVLEERAGLLARLDTVLAKVDQQASLQRSALDATVAATADTLERAGVHFATRVDAHGETMDAVSAQ
ncbi:MAG: DUF802 domain-containing protein, partial [Pseudomonadota bacterium]|nr:DUF802 domain-containing protein [Pseudomonadota bacterium]